MSEENTGYSVFKDDGVKVGDLQRAFVSLFLGGVTHAVNALVVAFGLLGTSSVVMAFKSRFYSSQLFTVFGRTIFDVTELDVATSVFLAATVIHFFLIYHSLYEIEKNIKQQAGLGQSERDKWLEKKKPELVIRGAGTIMLLLFAGKTGVEKLFPPSELVSCVFASLMFSLFIIWSAASLILNRKPNRFDPNVIGYLICDLFAIAIWIILGLYFLFSDESDVFVLRNEYTHIIQLLAVSYFVVLSIIRLGIGASLVRLSNHLGEGDIPKMMAQIKNIGTAAIVALVIVFVCNVYAYGYMSAYDAKAMKDLTTACPKLEKICRP
jgi:hypothetical protein